MKILITGGAGFIGYHLARDRLNRGDMVTIVDDLSRSGSMQRWDTLEEDFSKVQRIHLPVEEWSIGQYQFDVILHLAAQTAVTRSIDYPYRDFEVNLNATISLLEHLRIMGPPYPKFIFSSTNKVYGSIRTKTGLVDEFHPIDLRTPYGISKGAADFYTQEYGRLYGIPTVVLRKSCIFGPHQTAEVDQGWIAHFINTILNNKILTIYGTGQQTRDILYVDDLVELYNLVIEGSTAPGEVFNIGGGYLQSVSLLQAIEFIEHRSGKKAWLQYDLPRPSDQECYVSLISKAIDRFKWKPKIGAEEGIYRLVEWWIQSKSSPPKT